MSRARVAAGLSAAVLALAAPLVMTFEGQELEPYKDVTGILTVCYGETHNVELRKYTPQECSALLAASLSSHGQDIAACMPIDTPDQIKAAMLSFGYNVGASKFCASTMAAKLKAKDWAGSCAELSRWVFIGGKDCRDPANKCAGIVRRRTAERAMCEAAQ